MTSTSDRAAAGLIRSFGGQPSLIARAPGRVNLIGEHTDYNDGWVLPVAIALGTSVAARTIDRPVLRVAALDLGATEEVDLSGDIAPAPAGHWSNYVRGVAAALRDHGIDPGGVELAIAGDIPQGAGLSSSASLEIACGLALAALAGQPDIDRTILAKVGQRAEHLYAGCQCGIMDQLVSACAVDGSALQLDCRSLAQTPIPMPAGAAVLIVHSGVRRGLVDGAYNVRRQQCEAAAALCNVPALRDLSLPQLLDARALLDPETFRRARHVVTENERTLAAAAALAAGDYRQLGRLMDQSHMSMRDDFAITTPAIDALAERLREMTGLGARMTGGGFGGAVISVLPRDMAAEVAGRIARYYRTPDGGEPLVMVQGASAGARIVSG